VPSGVTLRVVPSGPSSVVVIKPSGATADRRVVPVTRLAVEKVLTRPICDVVVTVTLVSVTDRASAVKPPSGSASRLRRPSES
jgi:hypothetical protein